jgi:recombination protein RecT
MSNIRELVVSNQSKIIEALPRGYNADRVISLAMTAIRKNEVLQKCTPASLVGTLIQCSHLGLDPGITAHIVPFYNSKTKRMEAQFIPDYRGLIVLARRSKDITAIDAACVYEGDLLEYQRGTTQFLKHVQKFTTEDPDKISHAWAVAHFVNGDTQFEIMSRESILKIRDSSKNPEKGPWGFNFPEMARKTVLRRLCKLLPSDSALQAAIQAEEQIDAGISQSNAAIIDLEVIEDKPKSLKDKIKEKNDASEKI